MCSNTRKHNVLPVSILGQIRSNNLEIACDADSGGQKNSIVDLASNTAEIANADHSEPLIHLIDDFSLSFYYTKPIGKKSCKALINRIKADSGKYIPKDNLSGHDLRHETRI